jgi:hypothetical protein
MEGSFKDRQKGFESKWAHDEELRFKIFARRNKLLGQWAAQQLGRSGADADAYAKSVVAADFEKPGDEDVYQKVKADLAAKGADISEHVLRRTMDELLETAAQQIQSESKK